MPSDPAAAHPAGLRQSPDVPAVLLASRVAADAIAPIHRIGEELCLLLPARTRRRHQRVPAAQHDPIASDRSRAPRIAPIGNDTHPTGGEPCRGRSITARRVETSRHCLATSLLGHVCVQIGEPLPLTVVATHPSRALIAQRRGQFPQVSVARAPILSAETSGMAFRVC
jgi:hypothetical protein